MCGAAASGRAPKGGDFQFLIALNRTFPFYNCKGMGYYE